MPARRNTSNEAIKKRQDLRAEKRTRITVLERAAVEAIHRIEGATNWTDADKAAELLREALPERFRP